MPVRPAICSQGTWHSGQKYLVPNFFTRFEAQKNEFWGPKFGFGNEPKITNISHCARGDSSVLFLMCCFYGSNRFFVPLISYYPPTLMAIGSARTASSLNLMCSTL